MSQSPLKLGSRQVPSSEQKRCLPFPGQDDRETVFLLRISLLYCHDLEVQVFQMEMVRTIWPAADFPWEKYKALLPYTTVIVRVHLFVSVAELGSA